MRTIAARDLAHDLAHRAEELFRIGIADAKPYGSEMRGHAPDGGIVSMQMRGRKRGRWSNWQNQSQSGDALDFVAHIIVGGSLPQAYGWAINWLGGAHYMPAMRPPKKQSLASYGSTTPLWRVRELWNSASQSHRQPVASYLTGRIQQPMDAERLPAALRYAGACFHARDTGAHPAMVAQMLSLESGQHVATHVTWIKQTNDGWRKSSLVPPRKIFGAFTNSIIPLFGADLAELVAGERVLIGEGIENTLAGCCWWEHDPPPRVWAAASLGNLSVLTPKYPVRVTLVRDNDAGNDTAERLFAHATAHLTEQGCEVDVIAAPPGYADMADYVSQRAVDAG